MNSCEVWNSWEIKPPPAITVPTKLNFKGVTDLNSVTFDAVKTLRELHYFDKEAAILSRFLYKYKRIFRHDKGIQNLVKVNQCLKRYLKLDMSGLLSTFKQCLPSKSNQSTPQVFLPTRQMLKYVLLRLLAFSQLFARIIEMCKEAGTFIYKKLYLGWSMNLSLMAFTLISRILATSKYLVIKSIEWYSSFYKCLPILKETAEFLPEYEFPVDLGSWLGKVDLSPLKKKTFIDEVFEVVDLVEDKERKEESDEVQIINEKFLKNLFKTKIIEIDSDVEEVEVAVKEEKKGIKSSFKSFHEHEDLGVPIDEEETLSERPNKRKRKKEGKRTKWLNKVKKTLANYDDPRSSGGKYRRNVDAECLVID